MYCVVVITGSYPHRMEVIAPFNTIDDVLAYVFGSGTMLRDVADLQGLEGLPSDRPIKINEEEIYIRAVEPPHTWLSTGDTYVQDAEPGEGDGNQEGSVGGDPDAG